MKTKHFQASSGSAPRTRRISYRRFEPAPRRIELVIGVHVQHGCGCQPHQRGMTGSEITVARAVNSYLADAKARELAPATLGKLQRTFRQQFLAWADAQRLLYIGQITTADLTNFRNTWTDGALSKKKKHERLIGFFAFCIRNGWLDRNPALSMSRIKVAQVPTGYFSWAEFEKIEQATYQFGNGTSNPRRAAWVQRIRAMLLLLRWSGLRIQDAATLERSRLHGNKLLLYQAKTGTPVCVPLPTEAAETLRTVPPGMNGNTEYFFWTGNGSRRSAAKVWQRAFRRLFELADIRNDDGSRKRCFPHMFRDTFAVELLLAGVPLDQVAILLGHGSVKITERHYSPWVQARQKQLEASVQRAWAA